MSYLVLARKSRPQTFADVVGQKPIVRTLQNALAQGRVAHALIFSGIRGTGKTTLARIMAKALNCEQRVNSEPCNQCRSCREIADGASIDLQEVDGASNRGIQEIRELKEKIRFMPTSSRYKIIIIDEVHMLTTEAFNALLKTLEEPPDHVYFMFATTELHKVPVTILSRCQRYELKRLSHSELADHFQRLADQEGVSMEPSAVDMIVRESGGSVRDGLSLLDQIFSYCGAEVEAKDVVEVLGLVNHQLVADLGAALLTGDLATIYSLLEEMYLHGTDLKRLCNDLLQWFRNLVVCKISPSPQTILELPEEDFSFLQQTAENFSLESISAMFDLLLDGVEKVSYSQQPRLALELSFIRAVQFTNVIPVASLISRFDQLLAGQPLEVLAPTQQAPATPQRPPRVVADAAVPSKRSIAPASSELEPPHPAADGFTERGPQQNSSTGMTEKKTPELSHTAPLSRDEEVNSDETAQISPSQTQDPAPLANDQEASPTPVASAPPPSPQERKKRIRQNWDGFLKYVRERQPWSAAALQMAASVDLKEDQLIVHFTDSADCTMLRQKNNIQGLSEYILDYFQENLSFQFEVPGSDACSVDPASGLAAQNERRALANDPLVLMALDVFTGQVGDIRIGPRYRGASEQPKKKGENKVDGSEESGENSKE